MKLLPPFTQFGWLVVLFTASSFLAILLVFTAWVVAP
jgi:hypothetical protein